MIEHVGDECPVSPDTVVRVDLGGGCTLVGLASEYFWGPGVGDDGEGRILRYAALVEVGRISRALAEVARVGKVGDRPVRNLAIVAWGALALLEAELEAEQ